ncbi:hypothetical protein K437DRAFT_272139 [Tilletiaria anomala UBC 951]|uniref:Exoribonuclease phosphorolytic domain-containing protein n=1 Tax=Tilletiaria anomala (strain ATCC 24038 / CBS 436.72 / UBC 951) TaxID=1037660 RepID=A0A066WQG8_TILAU|nr:uncharacterized protein K437DRAFT_272139 [Tilletiaria anomala UBC 951]KDN52840.1 hypothetical protein K437DRAFT_272139 [Tilletiaria anomala UBC 951]
MMREISNSTLRIERDVSKLAHGSASFTLGTCSVVTSISGPMEAKQRDEQAENATLDFSVNGLKGGNGISQRAWAASLRELFSSVVLLHMHPRSLIRISSQLASEGNNSLTASYFKKNHSLPPLDRGAAFQPSHKAACINATSVALIVSGIPCKSTVASACCVSIEGRYESETGGDRRQRRRNLTTHPTPEDEHTASNTWLMAFAFSGHDPSQPLQESSTDLSAELVYCEATGAFSDDLLLEATNLCREAARQVYIAIRQSG